MNPKLLEQHARAAQAIRSALEAEADEDLTLDTIEGQTDFLEMLDRLMADIGNDEMMIAGITARQDDLAQRKTRLSERIKRRRLLIERAMLMADMKKIERPEYTLSIRNGVPQLNVYDEAAIPPAFFKQPPPVLDKVAIKKALSDGESITGASMNNGQPSLSIRTK